MSKRFDPICKPMMVVPVRLPPGRFKLATSPAATGLPPAVKTIGMVLVAAFAASGDDSNFQAHKFSSQREQPVIAPFRPAIFDMHVPALHIALAFHTVEKGSEKMGVLCTRRTVKKSNRRNRLLLGSRNSRPGRRASEHTEKFPSPHIRPQA